jgi:glyoxylase-like metal-dependent hydrolase (beta-lactamase superfamily II)
MMIRSVVTPVHLPAGMAGPEAMDFDVRCFLVPHPSGVILVDTGFDHSVPLIAGELAAMGAGWDDLTDVILTHDHPDHTGGLTAVAARAPAATVWAGPGDTFPVAVTPARDAETIRGLRVVATPGHTAGHLSLLATDDDALLIGDLAGSQDGRLARAPQPFTADADEAERSLHRVAALGFTRLYPSHGAPSDRPALRQLVDPERP